MKKYIYEVHLEASITIAARDEQQAIALAKQVIHESGGALCYPKGVCKLDWRRVYEPEPKLPKIKPEPYPEPVPF